MAAAAAEQTEYSSDGDSDSEGLGDEAMLFQEKESSDSDSNGERSTSDDKLETRPMSQDKKIETALATIKNLYENLVNPRFNNILTDFVDAEVFFIDGDSLLLELLAERSLDWLHGGQFLHLTFLFERFLQYFTDKDGVFHIIFFKEMEAIWSSQPSMLLARQAAICHLQNNTEFKVKTEFRNVWDAGWTSYIKEQSPAFLLLSDAESLPWEVDASERSTLEFLFHTVLGHSLHLGLNCVFISGIDLTATKLMGYYIESSAAHTFRFSKGKKCIASAWEHFLGNAHKLFEERITSHEYCSPAQAVKTLIGGSASDEVHQVSAQLSFPPFAECREVASILACSGIITQQLSKQNASEFLGGLIEQVKIFLVHVILLRHVPLKSRAQATAALGGTTNAHARFFELLHTSLYQALAVLGKKPSVANLAFKTASDLMDGRLFHWLLAKNAQMHTTGGQLGVTLPEDLTCEVNKIWGHIVRIVNTRHGRQVLESSMLPPTTGQTTTEPVGNQLSLSKREVSDGSSEGFKCAGVLPMDNELVNSYVKDLKAAKTLVQTTKESANDVVTEGREFRERHHWHTLKLLTDEFQRTKHDDQLPDDPQERRWFLKGRQKFSRYLEFYGKSLEKDIGKAQVITVTPKEKATSKQKRKASRESKSAKKIRDDKRKEDEEKERQKTKERWGNTEQRFDSYMKKEEYKPAVKCIEEFLGGCKEPEFVVLAWMKKAECCFQNWKAKRKRNPTESNPGLPVLVFEAYQRVMDFGSWVTDKHKKKLAHYMKKLGFDDIAVHLYPFTDGTTSVESARGREDKVSLSLGTSSARFQLQHMGHLLKREVREDRDPRVQHFIPDTWQRELLDAVDKRESAVIVAPTSSGKTFASYYCMEKILREGDDGVVVYVSPTRALVNQVANTIYARFRLKKLPPGRSVYGVFTREYQMNTLKSQILVTVPQCLEILLLSPARQKWAKQIRYVIFDEVHCLGQETGAEVWEHLLLLIRCPFLALSATIGNPDFLRSWLQNAQDFRRMQDQQDGVEEDWSYNVRLVIYNERYSDLEKSMYLPHPNLNEPGSREGAEDFVSLHPCGQLNEKQFLSNGFPKNMSLTPKETLQLFDVMKGTWPSKESLESLKNLDPDNYFLKEKEKEKEKEKQKIITKADARGYEAALKQELKAWADTGHLKEVTKVLTMLRAKVEIKLKETTKEWLREGIVGDSLEFVIETFVQLIRELDAQGKLPALVFCFDRKLCEELTDIACTYMLEQRERVREKHAATIDQCEKEARRIEKEKKRLRDKKEGSERGLCNTITNEAGTHMLREKQHVLEKHGRTIARCENEVRRREKAEKRHELREQKDRYDISEVKEIDTSRIDNELSRWTFADDHAITSEDKEAVLDQIYYVSPEHPFRVALDLGISYHHAGVSKKMRDTVEILFRQQYLRVVVATGTLALGIHMPCKTVVFAGDSLYLNSVQYRQMSGRSGRRGYDPVGNVVFFGLPYRKVRRLITANIPSLVGNFPITISLVLRLLLLTAQANDRDCLRKAQTLLEHPFICQGRPDKKDQIKYHFLFSVEFLARQEFINLKGVPQDLAGLACHLHYHEPANFVLISWLNKGLFHSLCKPNDTGGFSEDVMRQLVLVLAHLFGRRFLHHNFKRRPDECSSSSKVILDDLPKHYATALQLYNNNVNKTFDQYLTTVANHITKQKGEERKLPLSGIDFPATPSSSTAQHATVSSCTVDQLAESATQYCACSAFSALSGNSDRSLSGRVDSDEQGGHLLQIIRQDVYTDMDVVPVLPLKKFNRTGKQYHLNAYALDFFKHGSETVIVRENRMRSGEVYQSLKDFSLTISSISTSLKEMGPEEDNVVLAFDQLDAEYKSKLCKAFPRYKA